MTARQFVFLTTMMSAALLVVGQLYVAIPLLPGLAARFGTDLKGAALVGTAFGLAYATGFLVFGLLSDRIGRVRVILFGLLALTAATVLAALAETFSLLLAARALQGLAAATFPPAALSLVVESLPAERRPFGIAAMSFAFLGAAPATQVLGAALAERGFAPILSGAAILYFVAAAALWGLVRRDAVPRSGGLRRITGQ